MKRVLVALVMLIGLGVILPGLPALARPAKTPHENPEKAASYFDSAGWLLTYCQIAAHASDRQYQAARELSGALDEVNPPDDIKYLVDQYRSLYDNLLTDLDTIEVLFNQTNEELSRNRADRARQYLDSSENFVQDAENLVKESRSATREAGAGLGVAGLPAHNRLAQAYNSLEASTDRLADLITLLKDTRRHFNERYIKLTELVATALSLHIDRESAFVGDSVTVSGRLNCARGPLAAKTVALITEGLTIGAAVTGPDGFYHAGVMVPYLYKGNMAFTAQYEPSSEDKGLFLATESHPVDFNARFYPTRCEISVPENVYHGMPFTLSGEVSTDENDTSRRLMVSLDNLLLATAPAAGRFSLEVTIPPGVAPGRRALKIEVAPEGRYAGVTRMHGISLSAPVLHIEARTAAVVILPGTIKIGGKITGAPGPPADIPVTLRLARTATTVRTAPDGGFSGTIKTHALPGDAPLAGHPFFVSPSPPDAAYDFFPVNAHAIEITASVPGYSPPTLTVEKRILTVNPLSAVPGLVLLACLALALYRQKRAPPVTETGEITPRTNQPPVEIPAEIQLAGPAAGYTRIKRRILSAYQSGLATVERITGIIMAPSTTLREFREKARLPSPAAAAPFAELTALAESSLYSPEDPPDTIAARAEALAGILHEELHREPA